MRQQPISHTVQQPLRHLRHKSVPVLQPPLGRQHLHVLRRGLGQQGLGLVLILHHQRQVSPLQTHPCVAGRPLHPQQAPDAAPHVGHPHQRPRAQRHPQVPGDVPRPEHRDLLRHHAVQAPLQAGYEGAQRLPQGGSGLQLGPQAVADHPLEHAAVNVAGLVRQVARLLLPLLPPGQKSRLGKCRPEVDRELTVGHLVDRAGHEAVLGGGGLLGVELEDHVVLVAPRGQGGSLEPDRFRDCAKADIQRPGIWNHLQRPQNIPHQARPSCRRGSHICPCGAVGSQQRLSGVKRSHGLRQDRRPLGQRQSPWLHEHAISAGLQDAGCCP
mmetsp:Transcript_106748/g.244453  ORF Transcript_106748/g.244453 Transcript_106748/m.244453 type:complete len:327 (-) Transcript_106748:253-1233(-)